MWVFAVIILLLVIFLLVQSKPEEMSPKTYPARTAQIDFFNNGKHLYKTYFKDIQNAKHYVCVSFFIVKDDEFSHKFFNLLARTSERGVNVYLLIDRLGSFSVKHKDIRLLEQAGVHFTYSKKLDWRRLFYSINHRNHRKISIIDGKAGYIGGYNIGDEYINDHSKFSLWRDYHLRVSGEIIQDLLDLFCHDWEKNTEDVLNLPIKNSEPGDVSCHLIPSSNNSLEHTFIDLIDKAKTHISIGSPYFIPSEKIMQLIEQKLKENVKVSILYPHKSDHPLVKEASLPYLIRMHEAGAEVKLFTNGFYHAKALFIDQKVCDIGTANFDRRSLYINEEVNLIILDEKVTRHIYSFFEEDMKDSMPFYDDWIKQPNTYRLWLSKFFARLFHRLL
ncbi:cardiolipin synthase [Filobacillus milosensis]|uniref:Cardiolipin synthase n=1 Tax=Filobacillus milosensis TaxID=94137 RepID=A0A4Y8IHV9_9BACI|nr:phospholipase D-like domain-containing protein [Filobacillus milosensis]TFB19212.1 cardiolipin synthase [Filobacillus milosensis]